MGEFDFSTLNSTDLENLACDLLNAQEHSEKSNVKFKTYKAGKDKGVDFHYSVKDLSFEIIGQVKHYLGSGFNVLLRDIKNKEKPKVEKLKPGRYVLVTSVDLSYQNTSDLVNAMSPFLSVSDIYGKKDLNRLLDRFPQVLSSHFKLWFASTAVLRKILNYAIEGRSTEFVEVDIKRRLRTYVETSSLLKGRESLQNGNILILQGEPGVGKTTTAEILLYELIGQDYQLTYIYDDIKEAEKTLLDDENKQVFYFDDFLGSTEEEIQKSKGSESAILRIFKLISRRPNKKLIVSTRTFILNSALEASEKLRNASLTQYVSTVDLGKFSHEQKLQLLDNHIDQSDMNDDLKVVLQEPGIRHFIVTHANFSPRSVEFITSKHHVGQFDNLGFKDFIKANFNYPDKIWLHAYEQQIEENDRFLLNTMASFGDRVHISTLEKAFNARVAYEVNYGGYTRTINAFQKSVRRLTDGFIVKEKYFDDGYYQFINPSLIDFLVNYIKSITGEAAKISEAAVSLDQLTPRLYPITQIRRNAIVSPVLKERLLSEWEHYLELDQGEEYRFVLAMILFYYIKDERRDSMVCEHLAEISSWEFIEDDTDMYLAAKVFLNELESGPIYLAVVTGSLQLFYRLICASDTFDDALECFHMIKSKFDVSFIDRIDRSDKERLDEIFSNLINVYISDQVEEIITYANAISEANELENKILSIKNSLAEEGINLNPDSALISENDWSAIEAHNYYTEQMAKDD